MKTEYSYSYNYDHIKPIYKFFNKTIEASICIYKEHSSFMLVQKNKNGQQRLKLDEVSLNKMLSSLDNNGWTEVSCI